MTPSFTKEVKGEYFVLPNFSYFNCGDGDLECLQRATEIKYNLIEFSKVNGVSEKEKTMTFAIEYSNKVIKEYNKTGMVEILSDSKIGKCIIFYPDKEHYIAYVPDTFNIRNKFWKGKFIKSNKVEPKWYAGTY